VRRRIHVLLSMAIGLAFAAGSATAQTADWRFGGRALWVNAATTSQVLESTGISLDLRSGPGAEIDATLMFSDRFAAEFSIAGSAHRLDLADGDGNCTDCGLVWLVPLTVIGQYHYPVYGPWDPYVGLGVTWIAPFRSGSCDLADAGLEGLDLEGEPAFEVQLGVNYQMDNRWYANIDLRYSGASIDARATTEDRDVPPVTLDINPFVIGIGVGCKF
jgi:outer membrane protein